MIYYYRIPHKQIKRCRYLLNMSINHKRYSDVFHAYLVENADYDGFLEIPVIKPSEKLPYSLIRFSEITRTKNFNQWVHFYEDDYKIERIWNNPRKYVSRLQKFKGIITPDFSLYRDMPLVMQQWNTYRGKALGHWWQSLGMNVIPNVRWSDERSYVFCCNGLSERSIICVGSYVCLRDRRDRILFRQGLEFVIDYLHPVCIIVYGGIPDDVFSCCARAGIRVINFIGGSAGRIRAVQA